MSREPTISYEQVVSTAERIKADGGKPTVRSIRSSLGDTGSMATILKYLQQYQTSQQRQSHATDDLLDPSIVRAINIEIANKVQQATSEASSQLADLQSEADNLIAENELQAKDVEIKTAEFVKLLQEHNQALGKIGQLDSLVKSLTTDLTNERKVSERFVAELAKSEVRLESLPRFEKELVLLNDELAELRRKLTVAEMAAAVANAKLELISSDQQKK